MKYSNRLKYRLLVWAAHILGKLGFAGGVRGVPMMLAGIYVSHLQKRDSYVILDEGFDDVVWSTFQRELKSLTLPKGVSRDVVPETTSWCRDAIGVHKDVLLVGIHPTAFSVQGKCCCSFRYGPMKPFEKGHLRSTDLLSVENWIAGRQLNVIKVNKAIVLDEQMGHFGHWVFEQLPQLRLMQDRRDVHVIYNGMDVWKRTLLLDFGWPEDHLLPYHGDEIFKVDELWGTNAGHLNKKDLGWLRKTALSSYGKDDAAPKRLFVSRQGIGTRMIANFESIRPVLTDFDICVVQPESLGIKNAVRLFANAEFIIGPEGSGIRNMVWSEMAKVIEIFGHEVNYGQWSLAHALGFDYVPYLEDREVPSTSERWRDLDASGIFVNPDNLREFLSLNLRA